MADECWWAALVTFERRQEGEDAILPEWALGACGWMMALASDENEAEARLVRDVEHCGLRVIGIENERQVFDESEMAELDDHLASNFVAIEVGKQTVWGTIHCYKGEGTA